MPDEKKPTPSRLGIICAVIVLSCVLLLVGRGMVQKRSLRQPQSDVQPGRISTELKPDDVSDYLFSNGYVAVGEWESYQRSYDPDGSKLRQAMGSQELGQGYTLYRVYTSEMAVRLEALAKNRELALQRTMSLFSDAEELYGLSGAGAFLPADARCEGYCYDSGSFHFEGSFRETDYRFDLRKKSYFSEDRLLTPTHEDEQWVYISHGQPLLLSLGREHCLIHTALQDAYLTLDLPYAEADEAGKGISGVFLEALADSIRWDRIEG